MSLRAVVEIVVHLESFRNIDLFFQGIYYTRSRIYSKKQQGELPSQSANGKAAAGSEAAASQ